MASEIMAVALIKELSNSEVDLLTVASGHTYTILNISICETAGNAETFDLYIRDDAGADDYEILSDQAIGANGAITLTPNGTGVVAIEGSMNPSVSSTGKSLIMGF